MTAWIEAIAARVGMEAHMRDGTVEKFATITAAERDRLVALARGVETLAEVMEQSVGHVPMARTLREAAQQSAASYAAELRRLLDGRDDG